MMRMTPERVAQLIFAMSERELRRLNELLGNEPGFEGLGVREPRKPKPESPGDAVANPLPEDYWETAQ